MIFFDLMTLKLAFKSTACLKILFKIKLDKQMCSGLQRQKKQLQSGVVMQTVLSNSQGWTGLALPAYASLSTSAFMTWH